MRSPISLPPESKECPSSWEELEWWEPTRLFKSKNGSISPEETGIRKEHGERKRQGDKARGGVKTIPEFGLHPGHPPGSIGRTGPNEDPGQRPLAAGSGLGD